MHFLITILQLLAVPVLIALAAFFVAAEYAIVTIRTSKVEEMKQDGVRSALTLSRLKSEIGDVLATLQIGLTATNLLIGAFAEPVVAGLIDHVLAPLNLVLGKSIAGPLALVVGFFIVTFFTVVLSELLPKALTLQYTERVAVLAAPPIAALLRICRPLVRLMNWSADRITILLGIGKLRIREHVPSESELEILVDQADDAGEFQEQHGELLRRAFDFADLTVRNVMIPISEAGVMNSNAGVDELGAKLGERSYTRWLLRDAASGRINGIVNVKMAFFAKSLAADDAVILHDLAMPPTFVAPDLPLVDALELLRTRRVHIAVVNESDGRELGVVTLEDILAKIVGYIPSETKKPPPRKRRRR